MDFLLDWKSIGSLMASMMFIQTMIRDFVPFQLTEAIKSFIDKYFSRFISCFHPKESILIIDEELDSGYSNEVYDSIQAYLSSKCLSFAESSKVFRPINSKKLTFSMTSGQTLEENFHGFRVKWSFYTTEKNTGNNRVSTNRYFTLSFQPQYKEKVHSVYLPEIIKRAEIIQFNNEERNLYTNKGIESRKGWSSVPFKHPSTFDTLALNPVLKEEIKNDLLTFVKNKEFYAQVGRTWKRGYLLYGPPGTGKTSLIAAMANFLQYDIYDLELKSVENDSQLKKLLISTSNKSIIVMEDVDCSVDLSNRKLKVKDEENTSSSKNGVTLSGVLNFVDGLWSSCGGERLIILTTNFKGNLDSALLRPGRMDKHIHLSYIDFAAFKMLAFNYLHIEDHMLMKEVEEVLPLAKVTAAEIAEVFMSSVNDGDTGMKNATELMKKRLDKSSENMDTGKIVKLENEDGLALVMAE